MSGTEACRYRWLKAVMQELYHCPFNLCRKRLGTVGDVILFLDDSVIFCFILCFQNSRFYKIATSASLFSYSFGSEISSLILWKQNTGIKDLTNYFRNVKNHSPFNSSRERQANTQLALVQIKLLKQEEKKIEHLKTKEIFPNFYC